MSDLVERLRCHKPVWDRTQTMEEAAAEITSLRAQLNKAQQIGGKCILEASRQLKEKNVEIDGLRAQLAEARAKFEEILKRTKPRENDDDLLCVIAMLAEDFLDPSKRAPLREKLASLKEGE